MLAKVARGSPCESGEALHAAGRRLLRLDFCTDEQFVQKYGPTGISVSSRPRQERCAQQKQPSQRICTHGSRGGGYRQRVFSALSCWSYLTMGCTWQVAHRPLPGSWRSSHRHATISRGSVAIWSTGQHEWTEKHTSSPQYTSTSLEFSRKILVLGGVIYDNYVTGLLDYSSLSQRQEPKVEDRRPLEMGVNPDLAPESSAALSLPLTELPLVHGGCALWNHQPAVASRLVLAGTNLSSVSFASASTSD